MSDFVVEITSKLLNLPSLYVVKFPVSATCLLGIDPSKNKQEKYIRNF